MLPIGQSEQLLCAGMLLKNPGRQSKGSTFPTPGHMVVAGHAFAIPGEYVGQ